MASPLLLIFVGVLSLTSANEVELDLGGPRANAAFGADDSETDGSTIALYDPVLRLNKHSFRENILEGNVDEVAHWIVLFCPSWHAPCQALEPVYRQLTLKWQDQLNSAWLSREVSFAAVDCATEKVLCNSQHVAMHYPLVAHYHLRKMVKAWKGKSFETDPERLASFLQARLGAVASVSSAESADTSPDSAQDFPVDFLLIFAAIAGNAWFISRSGCSADASPSATSAKQGSESTSRATNAIRKPEQRVVCSTSPLSSQQLHDVHSAEL